MIEKKTSNKTIKIQDDFFPKMFHLFFSPQLLSQESSSLHHWQNMYSTM